MSVADRQVGDIVVLDVKGEMINNKEYGSGHEDAGDFETRYRGRVRHRN